MSAIFSTKIGNIEKFLINPFLNYPLRESISEDPLAVEIITWVIKEASNKKTRYTKLSIFYIGLKYPVFIKK